MTTSPWALNVWNSAAKTSLKTPTPIARLTDVSISKSLNAPYTHTFAGTLSDTNWANISRGMYFELSRARSGTKALWENGYILNVVRSTSNPGSIQLQCASSMWFLNAWRTLGNFNVGPGLNYLNVIDLLNGVSPYNTPEHMGVLPPGVTAQWVDWVNNVTSTITAVNWASKQITVTTGTGANFTVGLTLTDSAHSDSGIITAISGDVLTVASWGTTPVVGDTVVQSTLPAGQGDIWKGAWDTSMADVTFNLSHYDIYMRESTSQVNTAYSMKLDVGPLGDASGLSIWGGAPLLADMQTNHGYVSATGRADLHTAQSLGYAVICNAEHQVDFTNVRNIIFVIGKGKFENSLHNIAGGPPVSGGVAVNGWALYTPANGGTYYTKTATNYATYDGHVYTFIARQNNDGNWSYGVVDLTSVSTYGPIEYVLEEHKISDAHLLMDAALGTANHWSQPVESFTFKVIHPLTSTSGNPTRVAPGQMVDVHYSGQIPSVTKDANGQWISSGSTYTYLDYPGTADQTAVKRLKRCIQYDENWNNGQFTQTITLGQNKAKWKPTADSLTKQLFQQRHLHARTHSFTKYHAGNMPPFLCSNAPAAWESSKDYALYINPGAIAVADIPHGHFFTDGHKVVFSLTVTDGLEYLDFWLNKPYDNGTLLSPNPTPSGGTTRTYLALRLAFTASANSNTNSATSCGFYKTSDGSTWVQQGTVPRNPALDSIRRLSPGTYRVTVSWSGGRVDCHIAAQDPHMPTGVNQDYLLAVFNDKSPALMATPGAIGFMAHQGSAAMKITDLHATPIHPARPPKGSVGRPQQHPTNPSAKRRRKRAVGGGGGSGIARAQ